MSEPELCIFQQSYCNECPPMWDSVAGKCKYYAVVNTLYWGQQPTETAPTPIVNAMKPQLTGTGGVIQRILAMRPNLTQEAVERFIDEERAKAAGLLTEEAAAHLVASNLGLDGPTIQRFPDFEEGNFINNLTGEVVYDIDINLRDLRDGSQKEVANVTLTDGNQSVRIGIWAPLARDVAQYGKGDVITLTNLKVRPPYEGKAQLAGTRNTKIKL